MRTLKQSHSAEKHKSGDTLHSGKIGRPRGNSVKSEPLSMRSVV